MTSAAQLEEVLLFTHEAGLVASMRVSDPGDQFIDQEGDLASCLLASAFHLRSEKRFKFRSFLLNL